jgi:hypothetical protein
LTEIAVNGVYIALALETLISVNLSEMWNFKSLCRAVMAVDHVPIDRQRHLSVLDVLSFRAADCDTDHYLVAAKVGRERNIEKTKYMLLSVHQNADPNQDIKIANRSFENVSQFIYLGTAVTNQNLIQGEIKSKLNSGSDCYHSVQNLLSSRLLSKNIKIRICKTIILAVVLYGCETWSLTLREEHRLRVFANRVDRRGMK